MSYSVTDFVVRALEIANGPYRYGSYDCWDRCHPLSSGCSDCSGLVCYALNRCNIGIQCTGSFALSQMCHAANARLSWGDARNTPGALVFIGINEGQGGIPGLDKGHVAISLGNGYIVHAAHHAPGYNGILISPYANYSWTYGARCFWLPAYVPPPTPPKPPPPPPKVPPMPVTYVNEPLCLAGLGTWAAKPDFGVFTLDGPNGGRFFGSMAGNPAVTGRKCARIIKRGAVVKGARPPLAHYPAVCCPYELLATTGERYLPPLPPGVVP